MTIKAIPIEHYDYPLPDYRIAHYPLEQRDASKLLVMKGEALQQDVFRNIGDHLPGKSLLITNKTRVVNARLHFAKPGGAQIEIFCLEPARNKGDFEKVFATPSPVEWKCLVGNSKRWKSGLLSLELNVPGRLFRLNAERIERHDDHSVIRFSWDEPSVGFGHILELAGELPLPPYLNRKAEGLDYERYQTVFAVAEGSVAAPTAGLHFTSELIGNLSKNHRFAEVTLHVGAGTFKPVSSATIGDHQMHAERIVVHKSLIKELLQHKGPVIAVGTTSMRTLESLYWLGLQLPESSTDRSLFVGQWEPYAERQHILSTEESMRAILHYLETNGMDSISAQTALMIAPGYNFRIVNGLITNFHQPKSTLLLLVSAFVGEKWRDAYHFALQNNFRFLSYGDSCLFLP
ncbi:MAG: S-adenosylmethionine:tRNA ribosyltransferase-isomerase [Bacteroidia bacterium]|jgi:S-adenosylmethionine:tRNA ribosyltransferase-isomerase|nr:S-adenosylmethionine:tRNA ribosyltransferase-isomerase [Bacteroidia bacterium]